MPGQSSKPLLRLALAGRWGWPLEGKTVTVGAPRFVATRPVSQSGSSYDCDDDLA